MKLSANGLFLDAVNTVRNELQINLITDIYETLNRKERFFIQSLVEQPKN
jgi:hypothetical protein